MDPPDKSHWTEIRELVGCLDRNVSALVWLPLGADTTETPPAEDRVSRQCRCEASKLGMRVSTIRWAKGGHVIGCQLLYRVNANARCALRKAVEEIVHFAQLKRAGSPKWGCPVCSLRKGFAVEVMKNCRLPTAYCLPKEERHGRP